MPQRCVAICNMLHVELYNTGLLYSLRKMARDAWFETDQQSIGHRHVASQHVAKTFCLPHTQKNFICR